MNNMKQVVNDGKTTLTHDFIKGHEYEVVVRAIGPDGTEQAMEIAARNTVVIAGKLTVPSSPQTLTTTGLINSIALSWTNPLDYDFDHMEVWRSTVNDRSLTALLTKVAEVKGITYTDAIGIPNTTRYYWIRAVNTSGVSSDYYPNTIPGVSGRSIGVIATDIADFAVTATKTFLNTVILTGDAWSNNTPGAGSITWNAHHLTYGGAYYLVAAGNTANRYITWTVGNTGGSGTVADPYLTTYSGDAAYTSANNKFNIAVNESGTNQLVWNSSANMVIGSAFILDAAIVEAKIDNLAVTTGKIALLAVDTAQIAALAVEEAKIDNLAITTGKIALLAVDTAQIAALAVETAKIDNLAVTDAKINTLTANKLTAGTIDASVITVTNLNATNITTGTMTAIPVQSAAASSRVEIFPSATIGLRIWDDAANVTLVAYVGGGLAGDFELGDYFGGNSGVYYDASGGTFSVRGLLTADDITAGGTITGSTLQTANANQRIVIDRANNRLDMYEAAGANVVLRIDDDFAGVSTNPGILIDSSTGAYLRLSGDGAVGVPAPAQFTLLTHNAISVQNTVNTGTAAGIFLTRSGNWASGNGVGIVSEYTGTDTDFALFQAQFGGVIFDVLSNGILHIQNTVQIIDAAGGGIAAYTGAAYTAMTIGGSSVDFDISGAVKAAIDANGNLNVVGSYYVDSTQVVSNRVIDARCDDAINCGDATTDGVIDSLRDAMITHGLIAAA